MADGSDNTPATPEDVFAQRIALLTQFMEAAGHPVQAVSRRRTAEEQGRLFAKGRTAPGAIVTEKSGQPGDESKHQSGLAADFGFVGPHGVNQSEQNPWNTLGEKAREAGLEWGGDWTSLHDRPHVQLSYRDMPVAKGTQVDAGYTDPASVRVSGTAAGSPQPTATAPQPRSATMPEQNEVRRNPQTGQTVVWTGSQWMNFKNPNEGIPSGRTDADDSELLKQFLTTGGTMAGGAVGGMPGAIAGGAIGRTLGHVPEALHSAATGTPNSGSFLGDPAVGAMEGATQDVMPRVLGPVMKWGGRGIKALGEMLPENVWHRIVGGEAVGTVLGAPHGTGGAAFGAARPILTATGGASERAGAKMEGKNLSQHLQEMIDGLRGPEAPPLHSDLNAGAAEKYASDKAAKAAQQGAAGKASGLGADLGEAPPPIRPNWHGGGMPAEDSWPGMGPDVEPRAAPVQQEHYGAGEGPNWPAVPTASTPAPTSAPPAGSPRLAGKAPTLNQSLTDILDSLRGNGTKPVAESAVPAAATPAPTPTSAPATPATPKPMVGRALPRGDDFWGPGSRTRAGDFAQATEGSGNPLYDPQTPTNYLRELLRDATDPTDRAWLAKAIDQRYRIQRSISGMAGK